MMPFSGYFAHAPKQQIASRVLTMTTLFNNPNLVSEHDIIALTEAVKRILTWNEQSIRDPTKLETLGKDVVESLTRTIALDTKLVDVQSYRKLKSELQEIVADIGVVD